MSSQAWANILPIVIIAALIWLMISRQRKRARETANLQSSLAVGAEVMLGSGIFGTIRGLEEERVRVEVAPEVVIAVHRRAVTRVVTPAEDAAGPQDAAGPEDAVPDAPTDTPGTGTGQHQVEDPDREVG